ncbi:MAG TPA: PAS domain-containing protein, partial [Halobacteriales archaeon]|nr:PAS domain-containing protein [Halobacteriales archaeon]
MTSRLTDLVTERTREGFLILDGDGTVVDANPAARTLLGADGSIDWSVVPGEDTVDDESTQAIEVYVDGETRVI